MNVSDLQTVLGLSYSTNASVLSENKEIDYAKHGEPGRRLSDADRCVVTKAKVRIVAGFGLNNETLCYLKPEFSRV